MPGPNPNETDSGTHAAHRSGDASENTMGLQLGKYRSTVDGRFLEVNQTLVNMLGYRSMEELLDVDLKQVYVNPQVRQSILAVRSDDIRMVEMQWKCKDGTPIVVSVSARGIRNEHGDLVAFEGLVEDATRRKQAGAQLRAAIVHSPIATGVLADDGRTVSYNEALEDLTGYTADELCTVDDWFQKLCPHPEYRKEVRGLFDWMSRGDGPQTRELHITRKDGRERLVQFHISSFEGGQVIQMLDITKQREIEEALRNKQRMLHQLIELHERDRQLMAYELHDGFCQQLASAMMKFQAYQHLRAIDRDEAAKCFDGAMGWLGQSITEARRLIGGLRPPILDEAGIVAAVDYLVAEVAEDQGVRVLFNQNLGSKRLASPLETCLFRIIQESVRNARRYSKSHCVHIDLMEGGDAIVLKVQDWGVGFDTKMVEAGHFGLQGIRERARWLGGHAEIESAPGQGTCITVRLPLVETA